MIDGTHGRFRWTIIALLFSATTINYLDRQVLSLLQPALAKQFSWTNTDYANITSAFQIVYAVSMLFVGRIVDKIGVKSSYAWAIALWSFGAMLHAWALPVGGVLGQLGYTAVSASVLGFMAARSVLAIGEAGNFPVAVKVTAEYFPKKERSAATGIFNSGANVGAILAPLSVPFIAEAWGWQTAFVLVGALGFIWLVFWLVLYEKPEKQPRMRESERVFIRAGQEEEQPSATAEDGTQATWLQLLRYRNTWAFAAGKFLTDGVWWFFLFWLPAYLHAQYGMDGAEIALPIGLIYSMTMVGSIVGGWIPVFFMKNGIAAFDGRMRAMFRIALVPLVVLLAQPMGGVGYWVPVLLIGIGASAHQAWSANLFTTVSDLFPTRSVATVVGIGGMAGGLGGVLVSKLGGALFDHYETLGHVQTGYSIMFAYCATAYLLAWFLMKMLKKN